MTTWSVIWYLTRGIEQEARYYGRMLRLELQQAVAKFDKNQKKGDKAHNEKNMKKLRKAKDQMKLSRYAIKATLITIARKEFPEQPLSKELAKRVAEIRRLESDAISNIWSDEV